MLKRDAMIGAYLLVNNNNLSKEQTQTYKEKLLDVTGVSKKYFESRCKDIQKYLKQEIELIKLEKVLMNVISDFKNDKIGLKQASEYLKEIEKRWAEANIRSEKNLLEGRKFVQIHEVEENEKNEVRLHMSIVTDQTIKYDEIMFDEKRKEVYRPYYIEFISDYMSEEYLNKLNLNIEIKKSIWMEFEFINDKINQEEGVKIQGQYIFCASPLKVRYTEIAILPGVVPLEIINNEDKYLEKVSGYIFNESKKKELKDELDKVFSDEIDKCRITIFNVGQASFNLIEKNGKKIIFDIGDSKEDGSEEEIKNRKRSSKLINKIKPDCIIISHWDMDHILGIGKMSEAIYKTTWIVPSMFKQHTNSISAKRLMCFLAWNSEVNLIAISSEDMNDKIIFSNESFELAKGKRKAINLNAKNNFGLLLKVKGTQGKEAIFTGDCEYLAFPINFMNRYPENLIVPHHGSKMDFLNIPEVAIGENKKAFISSGKNSYKCKESKKCTRSFNCEAHPHKCHLDFLKGINYNIYETVLTSYYMFEVD